jgi:hypothetical protein
MGKLHYYIGLSVPWSDEAHSSDNEIAGPKHISFHPPASLFSLPPSRPEPGYPPRTERLRSLPSIATPLQDPTPCDMPPWRSRASSEL